MQAGASRVRSRHTQVERKDRAQEKRENNPRPKGFIMKGLYSFGFHSERMEAVT